MIFTVSSNHRRLADSGAALGIKGKFDESLRASEKAIRLDPNLVSTWYNKGGDCIDAAGSFSYQITVGYDSSRH